MVVYNTEGGTLMRLDKFLKVSRLIKRRTVANEACDAGRVEVNGKVAGLPSGQSWRYHCHCHGPAVAQGGGVGPHRARHQRKRRLMYRALGRA